MKDMIIAIPDIHGNIAELEKLLKYLQKAGYLEDHRMIFLGDYFDRGSLVKKLIDLCINLHEDGHIFLCGNHEYVVRMLITQTGEKRDEWIRRWISKYEDRTLESYGIKQSFFQTGELTSYRSLADEFIQALPKSHVEFVCSLPHYFETDESILIHAGIEKNKSWKEQRLALDQDNGQNKRGPAQIFSSELAISQHNPSRKNLITGHVVLKRPVILKNRIMLNCGTEFGYPLTAWVGSQKKVIRA